MKKRVLVAGILLIILAVFGMIGYFILRHQGAPAVYDHTQAQISETQPAVEGVTDSTDTEQTDIVQQAVLSESVIQFSAEESQQISEAILSLESCDTGTIMKIEKGTAADNIGMGDIFFLEGDETTPFGGTYIGKVTSVVDEGENLSYLLETPMIDEVFDQLTFAYSEALTMDNLKAVECVEGVTLVSAQSLENTRVSGEQASGAQIVNLNDTVSNNDLIFEIEVDLLEAFKLKKDASRYQTEVDVTQGASTMVYRTTTGMCYHYQQCPCVSRSQFEMTLVEAVDEGFLPCNLCLPPVLLDDQGVVRTSEELTMTGTVSLRNLNIDMICDWDILNGQGIENLGIDLDGDLVIEMQTKGNIKLEVSGRTTQYSFGQNWIKFEGLKERLFPLAAIHIGSNIPLHGNAEIRALTGTLPVSVIAMIYADIDGNISAGFTATFATSKHFDYSRTLYEDGVFVNEEETESMDATVNFELDAEVKGDVDVGFIGAGADLYVFNLKIVQLNLVELGAEAEGMLKYKYTHNSAGSESITDSSYYMRVYGKLLEMTLGFKAKADIFFLEGAAGIDWDFVFMDKTLLELGSKNETRYDSNEMDYSSMTARDASAVYYKDTDGTLVKEQDNSRTVIYSEPFFSICGIDSSYLYLQKANEDGDYDVYRVEKNGVSAKRILQNVDRCLTIDEEYIYYVESFDKSVVRRINRDSLDESTFADFSESVAYLQQQENGQFHAVTQGDDIFAMLFGGSCGYFLLDKDGNVVEDYGGSPSVKQLDIYTFDDYVIAQKITADGYLRNTAESVYWLSPDMETSVQTSGVSGWNYFEPGIVVTKENDLGGTEPYKMVLYSAADGNKKDLAAVNSEYAFFTLCKGPQDEWYYFDETDSDLILYCATEDFQTVKEVKRISLSELPCSLEECGVSVEQNRIYFYSMTDENTSAMLFRYDMV